MVDFRRGGTAAKEQAKKQNISFAKTRWLELEDGGKTILRLLDDSEDWIYVNQHNFVPTKGAPPDATEEERTKFPSNMSAVCRHDEAFKGIYEDCFICDHMINEKGKKYRPGLRLWARAVEREEVKGTQEMVDAGRITQAQVGKRVGFKDALVEEDILNEKGEPTGKKEMRRKIIILRLGLKNFFGALQGYYDVYGTVLDRDYHVTRSGKGTETDYNIVPLETIPNHDLRDPDLREKYEKYCQDAGVDLGKIIESQADDEFYARFFDTTKTAKSRKSRDEDDEESKGAPAEQQTKPQGTPPSASALAAMKERVRGGNRTASAATEPAASGAQNF